MKNPATRSQALFTVSMALFFMMSCSQKPLDAFNTPMVKDEYQDDYEYQGVLEKKFTYDGAYEVDSMVARMLEFYTTLHCCMSE